MTADHQLVRPATAIENDRTVVDAAAEDLRSAAEQATTLIGRNRGEALNREQAAAVLEDVVAQLGALEVVARASGASGPPGTRGEAAAEGLQSRLARVDPAAIPGHLAEDATALLLAGLRSACLANDVEAALPLGKAALRVGSHFGLSGQTALAHSDLAAMYGRREFTERAIEHLSAAIGVLEAAGEPVTPTLLNNLGNVYVSNERLDEALGCFERAAVAYLMAGDTFGQGIAISNQGRALQGQRRYREAAAAQVEALLLFRQLGRKAFVATTLAKLGTCYGLLGETETAVGWFETALREYEPPGAASLPFEDEVREAYGRALLDMGRPADALDQLERAERCAACDGNDIVVVDLLKLQADAMAALGRYQDAYARLSLYLRRSAESEGERGKATLDVMLVELESGLAADHELPALTSRVLTEANRALRIQAEKLERISNIDELTQQYNRRYLNQRLEEELRRARGRSRSLSLLLFDVDNFKAINDGYSHLIGDEVLRQVAARLKSNFRHDDVVARWGGEEFAVLLPDTTHQAALVAAEKARAAVAAVDWSLVAAGLKVTVSAGVAATADVTSTETGPALLKLADSRLYQAKKAGRNRIVAG